MVIYRGQRGEGKARGTVQSLEGFTIEEEDRNSGEKNLRLKVQRRIYTKNTIIYEEERGRPGEGTRGGGNEFNISMRPFFGDRCRCISVSLNDSDQDSLLKSVQKYFRKEKI